MYKSALVTTDGSSLAAAVLAEVQQVVDPAGNVTVIEVIDTPSRIAAQTTGAGFPYGFGTVLDGDLIDQIVATQRAEAEKHLASARSELASRSFTSIETVVVEGEPGPTIVAEAERRGVEVVLMATHGRSGLRRAVLGSVADHVMRHLDGIPMLLVRPTEE